jgi:5-oxoprolinase (ATP-hydrolysing) subunit C
MTRALNVLRVGSAVTVQDLGRPGCLAQGLSPGGAADRHALIEGVVLLGQGVDCAALEMAGFGGNFTALTDLRIALTGAPMAARVDGVPVVWNTSLALVAGQTLSVGAAIRGTYGYLHVGGGFAPPLILNSRSAHLAAGIGKPLVAGDVLPVGPDPHPGAVGMHLDVPDRCSGGTVRMVPGAHTALFSDETQRRFTQTTFAKSLRANRQGAELSMDAAPFGAEGQLTILSEPMIAGDVQMTGDGRPFVLLAECQTTGGYPRIGVVMPDDLPCVAQADPQAPLRFRFVPYADAMAAHVPLPAYADRMRSMLRPLIRKPADIVDLMDYQLISGAVTGWDEL